MRKKKPEIYGLLAEFKGAEELLAAARRAREEGYRAMDAYTPFPVHGLSEEVGFHRTRLPLIVLMGGLAGAVTGYLLQYWVSATAYPMNVGGRPFHSWPSFVPVIFEMAVLFAALSAVLGMLALNGLPQPYHPLFNVARFELASRNRFFLCIEAADPKFDRDRTRKFMESLQPQGVHEVEW